MTPKLKTFLERGFSTVVLLSLLGGAVAWNEPIGYAVLICVLCNLTSWEWFNMLKGTNANRWLSFICGLIYPWLFALINGGMSYQSSIEVALGTLPPRSGDSSSTPPGYTFSVFLWRCAVAFRLSSRSSVRQALRGWFTDTAAWFCLPPWAYRPC